jgi:osmotically-inducible protein OsmY
MRDLDNTSTSTTPRTEASPSGGVTRTLLAGIAIGATLSYLFDPARGARRRAALRDQAASLLRSAGRDVNAKARDAKNRLQGVVAEARGQFGDDGVTDDQLADRVRAALGHRLEHVRPIDVVADGGRVVLRGQVPEQEIETALATARSVRGVSDVLNYLQPARSTQSFAGERTPTP